MTSVALLKSNLFKLGGLEKYTLRLAKRFAERGCDVTILTTGPLSEEDKAKAAAYPFQIVPIVPIKSFGFAKLRHYDRNCQSWLKAHPHQIVFGTDRHSYQSHYRAGNGVHAEYLAKRIQSESFLKRLSFSINPLHRTILAFEKLTYESPLTETIFTNSYMVKQEILNHYRTPEAKIKVIHNGVEWEEMTHDFNQWSNQRELLQQELDLDASTFQFLFIGNGYQRKGLQYLLEGLSQLKDRNFHLSVLGKDKEIHRFKHLSQKLNLDKHVTFFGQRNDVRKFYQLADAVVIPSIYDPFANVTVEAIAMGVYVVSSKFNGASEVITDTNGCIINQLCAPDSVAEALQIALNHKKNDDSSFQIRNTIKYLEFNHQLDLMISHTLNQF